MYEQMYDCDLVLHHEMNAVEKLLGKESEPAILDVDHIASRNLLAISSSDHSITLWSIVNPLTGAYVFSSKIVNRYPVVFLKWCAPLKRLIASCAEYAQLWDIDSQRVDARLSHHKDRISDYVELGNSGLFATCSFDHSIAVWEATTQKVLFSLEGHIQGVLTMDYTQNTLLSSGFEYQAYCWSTTLRSLLVTLGGHQHRLIGAKFVSNRANSGTAIAVTGDEGGHFKLWDVSRCVKGSTSDLAHLLQSFELQTPSVCRFRAFACGIGGAGTNSGGSSGSSSSTSLSNSDARKPRNTENELADIIVGNLQLYRFRAVTQAEESAPPRHVVYNTVANTFVGSVDGCITVWNANSGAKVEEPIHIRDAEVCGIVFDVPRERKLFIATSVRSSLCVKLSSLCCVLTLLADVFVSFLWYAGRMHSPLQSDHGHAHDCWCKPHSTQPSLLLPGPHAISVVAGTVTDARNRKSTTASSRHCSFALAPVYVICHRRFFASSHSSLQQCRFPH